MSYAGYAEGGTVIPKHRKRLVHDLKQLEKWLVEQGNTVEVIGKAITIWQGTLKTPPETIRLVENCENFIPSAINVGYSLQEAIASVHHALGLCILDIGRASLALNHQGEMSIHEEDTNGD